MNAVIYNVSTGEITSSYMGPASMVAKQCSEGQSYILKPGSDETDYVDLEYHTIKPKHDYSLDTLPLPCVISIEGLEYRITEKPEFEFELPGEYLIEVDAGPQYLKKSFYVNQS